MFSATTEHDIVECPYDETHRVLRKRLQIHLLRCRKMHPEAELQKCPFNAIHLIPEPEYVHHVSTCPDRKLLTQYKYNPGEKPVEHEIIRHEKIEDEENWDEEEINVPDFKPTVFSGRYCNREKKDMIEEPVFVRAPTRSKSRSSSRTRSRSRSRVHSRTRTHSRSRSPLQRYPLIQAKREYFPPRREYNESRRPYFMPKREPESPPKHFYPRYAYGQYREDAPGPSSHYNTFRSRAPVKKEPTQVEFYDLDDDPYYNGGS